MNTLRVNLALVGAILLAGCAHDAETGIRQDRFLRVYSPQVPILLNGPVAVLLTNATGYSARVRLETDPASPTPRPLEGELVGQGSRLLFAPRETASKEARASGFSFVWDVASGSGYVLSEALQAYAPVSSSLRATNLSFGRTQAQPRDAVVMLNDGSSAAFQVWSESSRNNLPSRINSVTSSPRVNLTLSRIRFEAPPPDLFKPPEGFSKYPNPEALADEIAARQHNLRRFGHGPAEPLTSPQPGAIPGVRPY